MEPEKSYSRGGRFDQSLFLQDWSADLGHKSPVIFTFWNKAGTLGTWEFGTFHAWVFQEPLVVQGRPRIQL